MSCSPRNVNENIRRKMLELAIELRYLAADGQLNKPTLTMILSGLLEVCAQSEFGDTALPSVDNDNE